jgi:DNA-binding CsgD family transcriptional regulator
MFVDEGLDEYEISRRTGIAVATLQRKILRYGLREPLQQHAVLTTLEVKRIRQLADEGMPTNWIAEDLRISTCTVHSVVGNRPEAALEWRRVWQAIRRSEELYWHHHDVAPPARCESFTHLRTA